MERELLEQAVDDRGAVAIQEEDYAEGAFLWVSEREDLRLRAWVNWRRSVSSRRFAAWITLE